MSTRQRAFRGERVTEFTGIVRKWKRVEQYHDFRSNDSSKPFGYRWEPPKDARMEEETIEKESAPKRRRLVHVSALSRQQEPPGNQAGGAEEKPATLQASSKKLKLKILSKPL